MEYRIEKDTMGEVKVPAEAYYGAQTQRSIDNFKIAEDINKMPKEIIKAFAYLKHAAAITNNEAGILTKKKADLIGKVCKEILEGKLDEYFPLVVWQTGSGTQSNMNVNEVVAYRGHVLNGGKIGDKEKYLHPNDDVNKSQSSNDTFPTAMHIAAYSILMETTIPGITKLRNTLNKKAKSFKNIVKIGRTHFMDATPLTLGAGKGACSRYSATQDKPASTHSTGLRRAREPMRQAACSTMAVTAGLMPANKPATSGVLPKTR